MAEEQQQTLEQAAARDEVEALVPLRRPASSVPATGREDQCLERTAPLEFSAAAMLRPQGAMPTRGLRRLLYRATFGALNLGPGGEELRQRELVARLRTPVQGCRRVVVASRKGGVGKTTTCAFLAHTLATQRGDRVVAVDGNPDAGTLGIRIRRENRETITTLQRDRAELRTYADVRAYTSQAPSRLEVLAADDDPTITQALGEDDLRQVVEVLERFYSLICLDTGTGVLDSANRGILRLADQLVLVTTPAIDAGWAVAKTLEWLTANGHAELVRRAVVVLNAIQPSRGLVDLVRLDAFFASRCRAVARVPWDPALAAGAESAPDDLRSVTQAAYLHLAATVAADFGSTPTTEGMACSPAST